MTLGGPVTREGAREQARRELSRAVYHGDGPSWWDRLLGWIGDRIYDLFSHLIPHTPGGGGSPGLGIFALVLAAVVLAVALRWWLGPLRRTAKARRAAEDDLSSTRSAAQLRAEADQHAGRGDYLLAVRARLRAIVRMLEDRGVLDARPGRTAGELVGDVARAVGSPQPASPAPTADGRLDRHSAGMAAPGGDGPLGALAVAVGVFSETWYGGREGTSGDYQVLLDADAALSRVRPAAQRGTSPSDDLAVPA